MKRLQNEFTSMVNRGVDRHLRLAVTGLSRSGKTAFITSLVNQLLHVHSGSRLPLFSAVREERLLGVKPTTKALPSFMARRPHGQPQREA
jgi:predicted YcjX-like family ATPase